MEINRESALSVETSIEYRHRASREQQHERTLATNQRESLERVSHLCLDLANQSFEVAVVVLQSAHQLPLVDLLLLDVGLVLSYLLGQCAHLLLRFGVFLLNHIPLLLPEKSLSEQQRQSDIHKETQTTKHRKRIRESA